MYPDDDVPTPLAGLIDPANHGTILSSTLFAFTDTRTAANSLDNSINIFFINQKII